MDVKDALEYIHSLRWMSKKLGLTKIGELLNRLGNPQDTLKFVHVGGTNGKGSTSSIIAESLRSQGYKTGLYTSPFIMRFNERIMVSDCDEYKGAGLTGFKEISDEELAELTALIQKAAQTMEEPPSEFEAVTALGMLYFAKEKCDIVVLEVGMGGEFDATNIIKAPLVTVLVNIGFDHMQYLGNTIREIATTKSKIIKSGSSVVFYGEDDEALEAIENRCRETGCRLTVPDFTQIRALSSTIDGQRFCYDGVDFVTPLIGHYQRKNIVVAYEAVKKLNEQGIEVSTESFLKGLLNVHWIARLEKISDSPRAFVDGSHNPQGMRATIDTIKEVFKDEKAAGSRIVAVFGVMADKDVSNIVNILSEAADIIVCVQPEYNRAMACNDLFKLVSDLTEGSGIKVLEGGKVDEGIEKAKMLLKDRDVLLCLGSLYMASEVRIHFGIDQ